MGNSDSNPWIPWTQTFQEIEKIRFSYDLRKNPDDFNRYVSERVDRISKETLDKKRASFQKAHTDLGRYFDMDHNANYYKLRNADLLYAQSNLLEQSRAAAGGLQHDKDLTRRQTEVNEWYFNDKLETLFFLQIFFMVTLALAIILYLQKNAFITAPFAAFLTMILLSIVLGTGFYRSQYTSKKRDARFWHQRKFYDKKLFIPTAPKEPDCGCDNGGNLIPDALSNCAKKALGSAKGVGNAMSNAASPYGQAALAGVDTMGQGLNIAGRGVGSGLQMAAMGPVIAGKVIFSQALDDSKAVYNQVGDAANRAENQLEADTLAYISGDGRPKPQPSTGLSCPF